MAGKRWDISIPGSYEQSGETKTKWTRIGVMFEGENGKGPRILLDALPIADKEGRVVMMGFEPKEKGERGNTSAHGGGAKHHEDNADIPF